MRSSPEENVWCAWRIRQKGAVLRGTERATKGGQGTGSAAGGRQKAPSYCTAACCWVAQRGAAAVEVAEKTFYPAFYVKNILIVRGRCLRPCSLPLGDVRLSGSHFQG